jgi:hypothetical protein
MKIGPFQLRIVSTSECEHENAIKTKLMSIFSVPPSDLLLRLGEYDLSLEEEPYGYQERRVQIVASHPQFDPRTFEYDLALLR